jgi:hypothetical protein
MSELSARLGLYVAIDKAAMEARDRLQAAADVIPLYRLDDHSLERSDRRLGTVGWHKDLEELLPEVTIPSLSEALAELNDMDGPSELDQARRLRAAWALARVLPKTDGDLMAGMLMPLVGAALSEARASGGFDRDEALREAHNMVAFLTAPDGPRDAEKLSDMVQGAAARTWVSTAVAVLANVSCLDRPVWHRNAAGQIDAAAHIDASITDFKVGNKTLAQVRTKVKPTNWPACLGSFWCEMHGVRPPSSMPVGASTYYREVVGDCPTAWFSPYLSFATIDDYVDANGDPNGFELQYALASPDDLTALNHGRASPLIQDARLTADQGSVIIDNFRTVASGDNRIDITTSKTIGFPNFSSGGVALFACITGWADQTRVMMSGCLGLS